MKPSNESLMVSSDLLEANGFTDVAIFLRDVASGDYGKSFITGSRKYGSPTPESDIDLAVVISKDDERILHGLCPEFKGSIEGGSYMFGKLNLICLTPNEFDAWRRATDNLVLRRPVTRPEAVREIDKEMFAQHNASVAQW